LLHERLFGGGPWLAGRELTVALNKKIDAMGLSEPVPETPDTLKWTALGREINMQLMETI
jgi:hypothetical protein